MTARSRLTLPLLAIAGVVLGVWLAMQAGTPPPIAQPVTNPATAPYQTYVAGGGMIEASTRNIAVSAPIGGVVADVYAKVGDRVRPGQPLFSIDGRDLDAQRASRRAAETLARIQVREAEASLADAHRRVEQAVPLHDRQVMSRDEFAKRSYEATLAEAKLGTARANADLATAQLKETETAVERLTVRAPVEGDILQVNVALGQYAQTGVLATPLVIVGDTRTLHVRVDIDENDAWRFKPGAPAKAFLRGNSTIAFDLRFTRVEPFVVPKTALTGLSTERVDTRVLQVLYSLSKGDLPVYVGQQVDVYIEVDPNDVTHEDPAIQSALPGCCVPR